MENEVRNVQKLATESRPRDGSASAGRVRAGAKVGVPSCARDMPEARATTRRPESKAAGMAGKEAGAVIVSKSGDVRIAAIRVFDFGGKA